jgi:2'-5' RNA ligase
LRTGLILEVAEIAPLVDRWRVATLADAQLGAPPHVTVLFPWVPAPCSRRDRARAAAAIAGVDPFWLAFTEVARFPAVVWLRPDPEAPVLDLIERITRAFPDYPLYDGAFPDPQPHLTVAQGHDDAELTQTCHDVQQELDAHPPVRVQLAALSVIERQPDQRWLVRHRLRFGQEPR